jgi:hypothetical protein
MSDMDTQEVYRRLYRTYEVPKVIIRVLKLHQEKTRP